MICDAFLSYNSRNEAQARKLYEYLKNSGLRVFFDRECLQYGRPFQEALELALSQSTSMLVLIGPHGEGRWHAEEQYAYHLISLDSSIEKPVIPVLLPGAQMRPDDLPLFLRRRQVFTFKATIDDEDDLFALMQAIPTSTVSGDLERPFLRRDQDRLLASSVSFYDRECDSFFERWRDNLPLPAMQAFLVELRKHVSEPRILDAGCGPGYHAGYFRGQRAEVTGVDLCRPFIGIANKSNIAGVRFLVGDMRDLQRTLGSRNLFDGVWACGSCLHIAKEGLSAQMDEFTAVLKPGGVLGISVQVGAPSVVQEDGRFFERYQEKEIVKFIERRQYEIVNVNSQISKRSTLQKRKVKRWLNVTAVFRSEKEKMKIQAP